MNSHTVILWAGQLVKWNISVSVALCSCSCVPDTVFSILDLGPREQQKQEGFSSNKLRKYYIIRN